MKDAITYANDAGFFSFNVVGWKNEFERLIEAVRADAIADHIGEANEMVHPTVKDSLTAQDHIRDATKMVALTTEQAQQIEEALLAYEDISIAQWDSAIATIRAARAQEQAEQPVSQEYQDHLVNQSFDWAAMAAKHQFMECYRIGLAEMREKCAVICEAKQSYSAMHANTEFAAVIRSINFEGDTGFRPVSEMIAEHKQDPKKAAAIEKAKMRKAEQEPVMDYEYICALREGEQHQAEDSYFFVRPENDTPTSRKMFCQGFERGFHKGLKYASPVRTKDLTDEDYAALLKECRIFKHQAQAVERLIKAKFCRQIDLTDVEIKDIANEHGEFHNQFARAVIAADREKNRG